MINESELNISNLSYTNKDFEAAYAEILDIATKISNRWNPTNSNESDPGVVLLKLLAFFVDKLNFNVDKNTLENFLLSCTQESSMRDLCEMNGYSPRYYNAATVDLSFMYTGYKEEGESEDALEPGDKFTLKAFETSIEDSESSVSYVLMQDVDITEKNREVVRMAMEGSWKMITVEGSEIIRLSNLDDNHRIYFPVANVAENGVRIFDTSGRFRDDWQQVKNLNTVVPGTKAYKFGFDSVENLPYLEFTDDISQLIGSGIEIGYIITSGVSGNIKANYLTQLKNETEVTTQYGVTIPLVTEDSECLSIINRAASINGANPETINEAYNSFKKTVGTFDTLVTCRDYANAIYNLFDEADLPIVSNVQVSDRRTDINYAKNILTHDQYGTYVKNETNDINAFDVCLYPLKPIKYIYSPFTFNSSFLPLEDKFFQIENKIEDHKTLSHTYKEMANVKEEGIIYLYKVYYKLEAKITTKYKVNGFEQIDILAHVYDAMYKNFNARNVDYGYEIPYETLLSVIENADNRIKSVVLDEPTMSTKVLVRRTESDSPIWKEESLIGDSGDVNSDFGHYADMLAKNITAGRVPLFSYDEDFTYQYGEFSDSETPIYKNIKSISTHFNAPVVGGKVSNLPLSENETLQLVAPSYGVELSYVSGVCYNWTGEEVNITDDKGRYQIKPGEKLLLYYEDGTNKIIVKYLSDGAWKKINDGDWISLQKGDIYIRPSGFTLKDTSTLDKNETYVIKVDNLDVKFYNLATKEEIQILDKVETTHRDKSMPCYWILNTNENALFTEDCYVGDETVEGTTLHIYERILTENEFFMWSSEQLTDLEIIGSGTKLTYKTKTPKEAIEEGWKLDKSIGPNAEEISDAGLAAFAGYPWRYINFSSNPITFTQMDILTLTAGDEIVELNVEDEDLDTLGNSFTRVTGVFTYKLLADEGEIQENSLDLTQNTWKAKTRLDLNAGPNIRQLLGAYDTVEFVLEGTPSTPPITNCYLKFNTSLQTTGGTNLDMKSVDIDGEESYPLKALAFQYEEPAYEVSDEDYRGLTENQNGEIEIPYNVWAKNANDITLTFLQIPEELSLICIYSSNDRMKVKVESDNSICYYNEPESSDTELDIKKGTNVIDVTNVNYISLKLDISGLESGAEDNIEGALCVGRIVHPTGLNDRFFNLPIFEDNPDSPRSDVEDLILSKIRSISSVTEGTETYNIFDYVATLDSSKVIEVNDLSSPLALFDVNNVCNKFTIAQVAIAQKAGDDSKNKDFYSEISIARASKL